MSAFLRSLPGCGLCKEKHKGGPLDKLLVVKL
jgi:hypothetical protein